MIENFNTYETLLLYDRCESYVEKMFFKGLVSLGLRFLPQYSVGERRIDFVLGSPDITEDLKIGIEISGHEFHTGIANIERDHERDIELTSKGWRIYYLTGRDIVNDLDRCLTFARNLLEKEKKIFYIHIPEGTKAGKLNKLKSLLLASKGEDRVALLFSKSGKKIIFSHLVGVDSVFENKINELLLSAKP